MTNDRTTLLAPASNGCSIGGKHESWLWFWLGGGQGLGRAGQGRAGRTGQAGRLADKGTVLTKKR